MSFSRAKYLTKASILQLSVFFISALCSPAFSPDLLAAPKYGPAGNPRAIPLAQNHSYFQTPESTQSPFWALISFYFSQVTGASCGSASLAMAINAARTALPLTTEDKVLSEQILWKTVDYQNWAERVDGKIKINPLASYGLELDFARGLAEAVFKTHGFPKTKVVAVRTPKEAVASFKQTLISDLTNLSLKRLMLANFDQKIFTNDASVGHIAPVGAFDPIQNKVLILDPDREYYEPYWVTVDTFIEGMSTQDRSAQKTRGYLVIETEPAPTESGPRGDENGIRKN